MACTDQGVADLVDSRLRPLRTVPGVSGPDDVVVEIRGPGAGKSWPPSPTGPGRPIYDAPSGQIEYFDESDELFVYYERRVRLLCSLDLGRIEMSITGSGAGDAILATHPLLTIALLETMKRFGRFPLHAGALSVDGRGILLPGSTGAGKSTLTVALIRAGFDFLSDDTVFLEGFVDGIVVSGFPDEIDVTENTVTMFSELADLAGQPLRPGRDKHGFRVEEIYGITPATRCRPAALVFPRVVPGSSPQLEMLKPSEALLELIPNVLLTQPEAVQSHLDMLARLVGTVPCYSFRLGVHLDAATACLAELVT